MERLHKIKETLICGIEAELASGIDNADCHSLGQAVDMVKDLSEAIYYCTVNDAMNGGQEPRYGYNSNRYADGRYAPAGHGNKTGYTTVPVTRGDTMGYRPYMDQEPYVEAYMQDPEFVRNMRMGYTGGHNGNTVQNPDIMRHDSRYGRAYNDYRMSRRHYTNTNSQEDRKEMEKHANEHIADTIATMREIWDSAEEEQRKRMKADLSTLLGEMND